MHWSFLLVFATCFFLFFFCSYARCFLLTILNFHNEKMFSANKSCIWLVGVLLLILIMSVRLSGGIIVLMIFYLSISSSTVNGCLQEQFCTLIPVCWRPQGCQPACPATRKFCHGRCVYFGRMCLGGICSNNPFRSEDEEGKESSWFQDYTGCSQKGGMR